MNKRTFLKTSILGISGILTSPFVSKVAIAANPENTDNANSMSASFSLPALPYPYDALEPNIDARTMEIHHGRHHAAYVNNLNNALQGASHGHSLEDIMKNISSYSTSVRNNGGGHYNHNLFWEVMSPKGGGRPSGELLTAINASFGSFGKFQELFSNAAATRFGSGWAWLVADSGKLKVTSTPNQDNPLMNIVPAEERGTPVLGIDVWEHAYYLHYQNRRGDYISAFWNVVDWDAVAAKLRQA